MIRIALVSSNRVLMQGIKKSVLDIRKDCEVLSLNNYTQALLDIETQNAGVIIIDAMDENTMEKAVRLCEELKKLDDRKVLLLVGRCGGLAERVIKAKHDKLVDDFVFYDSSMEYLIAKLEAL